jgi:carbon monoxide dehydrogenase subunit G
MELKGRQKVKATPATLWTMLMDTDTLSKIVPGIKKLEKTGENSYKSTLEIKIGPASAAFSGELHMEDVVDGKGFTLKSHQYSKLGNANSTMKIELAQANPEETEVVFEGEIKITGLLASMGQRVFSGVAHVLTKQFFANLDHQLAKQKAGQPE